MFQPRYLDWPCTSVDVLRVALAAPCRNEPGDGSVVRVARA